MKSRMNLKIPVTVFREGRSFIAYSPVLDLSTSGKNYKEVQRRFEEAVKIFFEELLEMGTIDEVLTGLGWIKMKNQWNAPIPVAQEFTNISVPLHA